MPAKPNQSEKPQTSTDQILGRALAQPKQLNALTPQTIETRLKNAPTEQAKKDAAAIAETKKVLEEAKKARDERAAEQARKAEVAEAARKIQEEEREARITKEAEEKRAAEVAAAQQAVKKEEEEEEEEEEKSAENDTSPEQTGKIELPTFFPTNLPDDPLESNQEENIRAFIYFVESTAPNAHYDGDLFRLHENALQAGLLQYPAVASAIYFHLVRAAIYTLKDLRQAELFCHWADSDKALSVELCNMMIEAYGKSKNLEGVLSYYRYLKQHRLANQDTYFFAMKACISCDMLNTAWEIYATDIPLDLKNASFVFHEIIMEMVYEHRNITHAYLMTYATLAFQNAVDAEFDDAPDYDSICTLMCQIAYHYQYVHNAFLEALIVELRTAESKSKNDLVMTASMLAQCKDLGKHLDPSQMTIKARQAARLFALQQANRDVNRFFIKKAEDSQKNVTAHFHQQPPHLGLGRR